MSGQRLPALERAAVVDAVASAIRHDTRNKLSTIRNAAYYIRRKIEKSAIYETDPRIATFFRLIEEALSAIESILLERMGNRHTDEGPLFSTRLGEWLESALREAAQKPEIAVSLHREDHTTVSIDPQELILLLRCLLDNAIEAMPDGGSLKIRTYEEPGSVLLSVEDTGPGFTTESEQQGCDLFYTTKPGHVGLGLCLVRRIASRYGGTVSLGPEQPGGLVTVRFTISAALQDQAEA